MNVHSYEEMWKDACLPEFKYGVLRTKNLADEIHVGLADQWTDEASLDGFDHILTVQALDHFNVAIQKGLAETHHDEFARDCIALCCRFLSLEMGEGEDSTLEYEDAMLAARALRAFSLYLQGRLDELPPEQAEAA
jgi:hypothetical protein